MRVQIAKEVFIEAEVPVGIDEITESLQYELNHAQTVNEFEGSSEHSKTFVVQQLLNSAYQCVAAINDEMIDRVSIENRELISDEVQRFSPKDIDALSYLLNRSQGSPNFFASIRAQTIADAKRFQFDWKKRVVETVRPLLGKPKAH